MMMFEPDEVYKKLISEVKNSRVKRSLEAIHDICREQHDRKSQDFSYESISKLGSDKGVPAAQSIRNKTGEKYQALIRAWQSIKTNRPKKKITESEVWIDKIEDPTVRLLVRDLYAEKTSLKNEVKLLKNIKTLNIDMRPVEHNLYARDSLTPKLLESELDALKSAINESTLSKLGWCVTERGGIVDNKNRTIFKNGFVTGIGKMLALDK
jgi:hypothetical protein